MKGLLSYKKTKSFFLSWLNKRCFKFFVIFFITILIEVLNYQLSERNIETNFHYIFTFWEPHDSLPGYIKLCIKTWKKYLPKFYKIVVLDYQNLQDYLDFKLINKILCKQMTLSFQSDAIRVAILQKYGGIWMDCDTIITNSKCMNIFNGSDLFMFGISKENHPHIGFIYASKNSTILKAWLSGIIKRVRIYKNNLFFKHIFPKKIYKIFFEKLLAWDYLGNGILNEIIKNTPEKDFKLVKREEAYVFPELHFLKGPESNCYKEFYFSSGDPLPVLKKCKGMIILHNSWTPNKYKEMSEEKFLLQDIMLARLLSKLLNSDS